jgi:hypothetical protein
MFRATRADPVRGKCMPLMPAARAADPENIRRGLKAALGTGDPWHFQLSFLGLLRNLSLDSCVLSCSVDASKNFLHALQKYPPSLSDIFGTSLNFVVAVAMYIVRPMIPTFTSAVSPEPQYEQEGNSAFSKNMMVSNNPLY